MPEQPLHLASARGEILTFERSTLSPAPFHGLGVTELHLTGGGHCFGPISRELVGHLAAEPKVTDSRPDHQRRPAPTRPSGSRRPASAHSTSASTHCARTACGPCPARMSCRACCRHRRRSPAGFAPLKAECGRSPRFHDDEVLDCSNMAGRSAPKSASSNTWTSAARPIGPADQVAPRELLSRIPPTMARSSRWRRWRPRRPVRLL